MIIYQIIVGFIMFGSISYCKTINGIIAGIMIWIMLSIIPLFIFLKVKDKKITKKEQYVLNKQKQYEEDYFNEFGELP